MQCSSCIHNTHLHTQYVQLCTLPNLYNGGPFKAGPLYSRFFMTESRLLITYCTCSCSSNCSTLVQISLAVDHHCILSMYM